VVFSIMFYRLISFFIADIIFLSGLVSIVTSIVSSVL
jgi:hypothetical protein